MNKFIWFLIGSLLAASIIFYAGKGYITDGIKDIKNDYQAYNKQWLLPEDK